MLRKFGFSLGVLLPLLLWFLPPGGLSPQGQKALSLSLFAILFYIAEPIPPALTSLIFMLLLTLLQVVRPDVAFSGFAAPAFWLVFSAFLMAAGLLKSGLARRPLFAEVLGISVSFFPYQAPPLLFTQAFGAYTSAQLYRVLIPYGLLSLLIGIPLTILYWWGIGYLERRGIGGSVPIEPWSPLAMGEGLSQVGRNPS